MTPNSSSGDPSDCACWGQADGHATPGSLGLRAPANRARGRGGRTRRVLTAGTPAGAVLRTGVRLRPHLIPRHPRRPYKYKSSGSGKKLTRVAVSIMAKDKDEKDKEGKGKEGKGKEGKGVQFAPMVQVKQISNRNLDAEEDAPGKDSKKQQKKEKKAAEKPKESAKAAKPPGASGDKKGQGEGEKKVKASKPKSSKPPPTKTTKDKKDTGDTDTDTDEKGGDDGSDLKSSIRDVLSCGTEIKEFTGCLSGPVNMASQHSPDELRFIAALEEYLHNPSVGDPDSLKTLEEFKNKPNILNVPMEDGKTALHFAMRKGDHDLAQFLLSCKGIDPLATTLAEGLTPLHMGTRRLRPNNPQLDRKTLGALSQAAGGPAALDVPDFDGNTPLAWACYDRNVDLVDYLLLWGHKVTMPSEEEPVNILVRMMRKNPTFLQLKHHGSQGDLDANIKDATVKVLERVLQHVGHEANQLLKFVDKRGLTVLMHALHCWPALISRRVFDTLFARVKNDSEFVTRKDEMGMDIRLHSLNAGLVIPELWRLPHEGDLVDYRGQGPLCHAAFSQNPGAVEFALFRSPIKPTSEDIALSYVNVALLGYLQDSDSTKYSTTMRDHFFHSLNVKPFELVWEKPSFTAPYDRKSNKHADMLKEKAQKMKKLGKEVATRSVQAVKKQRDAGGSDSDHDIDMIEADEASAVGAAGGRIKKPVMVPAVVALARNNMGTRVRQTLDKMVFKRVSSKVKEEVIEYSFEFSGFGAENFEENFIEVLNSGEISILSHPVIRAVCHRMWMEKFRYRVVFEFVAYLVFMTLYTLSCLAFSSQSSAGIGFAYFFILIASLMCVLFLGLEVKEARRGKSLRAYLNDFWNLYDLSAYISVVLTFFCMLISYSLWQVVSSVSLFIIWLRLFQYLKKFDAFGVLVLTLTNMIRSTAIFVVFLFIFLLGFAMAFHVLFVDQEGYRTVWQAFTSVFRGMLGDFDYDTVSDTDSGIYGRVLYVLFTMAVFVMMLNFLVALLASKYDDIRVNANELMHVLRSSAIHFELNRMSISTRKDFIISLELDKMATFVDKLVDNDRSVEVSECVRADKAASSLSMQRSESVNEKKLLGQNLSHRDKKALLDMVSARDDCVAKAKALKESFDRVYELAKECEDTRREIMELKAELGEDKDDKNAKKGKKWARKK